ncbi:hypothetical protein [Methylosinus sp. Sm6]|uniref:hypothetical protein n=1 Tax=Methylosinus sp. Sm6 TaxID=2866948 RepID=UPI001C99966A|nr:hypothetical protein [Methylosinus sp. Sm6]MBY6240726.1 hypothetical protein [Methylosinus sp. Sm6]
MGDTQERKLASQQVAIDVRKQGGSAAFDGNDELWSTLGRRLAAASGRMDSDAMESALTRGDIDGAILAMLGRVGFSSKAPAESEGSLVTAQEMLEEFCASDPPLAFDLALASLKRSADMMAEIVDETRRDLIEIEIRRKQIDRTQARTREILEELIGESR